MIVLHDCDGNYARLDDPAAFLSRVDAARRDAWRGETGQVGLEFRGAEEGSAWLFLSLVADGRYLVYSQRPSGEKIHAVDPSGRPQTTHEFLLAGRQVQIDDADLVSTAEAVEAARYFILQDGLLTPVVHWRRNGAPYWPDFG